MLGVGVLTDVDHLFDFYQWYVRRKRGRVYLLFHAWEYSIAGLLALVLVYYHPMLLAVVLAHLPELVLNSMIGRPEAADAMVAALLTTITRAKFTEKEKLPTIGPDSVRLVPLEQTLIDQMGDAPLTIARFPFFIGRKSENKDSYIDGPAALILQDRCPFRLSRRHFYIDREDGLFVVCDHKNFRGAIINGTALTASVGGLKIPLDLSENKIIAGDADSPFRFTCIVPS